ncbi:hypothetical protein [Prosthecomicrobium sp. N25]|uniref:hypothetical protein n=1 Tax=Prosthecomicrobium sp. N25 TaxID=3129254 RepID=UPI00307888CD
MEHRSVAEAGAAHAPEAIETACLQALVAALLETDDLSDMLDRVADRAVAQLRGIAALGRAQVWGDEAVPDAVETA